MKRPRLHLPRTGALVLLGLFGAVLGCRPTAVVRVVDGVEVTGRYISPRAYAAYARGVEAEARGSDEEALAAFLRAASRDAAGVELWTKLGAVRCRLGQPEQAARAFSRAEELDADYAPLWAATARCAERRGEHQQALQAARMAARLDPDHLPMSLLVAALLEGSGDVQEATRWLRGVVAWHPRSSAAWSALAAHSDRQGHEAWARYARSRLGRLLERRGPSLTVTPEPPSPRQAPGLWAGVDEALLAGDLRAARRQARRAHLSQRQLGARALLVGRPAAALEHATLLLDADPSDTDARAIVAVAADLLGQRARVLKALRELPADAQPASAVGRLLLGELLLRHVGDSAARLWLDAPTDTEPADVLPEAFRQRLLRRLRGASAG